MRGKCTIGNILQSCNLKFFKKVKNVFLYSLQQACPNCYWAGAHFNSSNSIKDTIIHMTENMPPFYRIELVYTHILTWCKWILQTRRQIRRQMAHTTLYVHCISNYTFFHMRNLLWKCLLDKVSETLIVSKTTTIMINM